MGGGRIGVERSVDECANNVRATTSVFSRRKFDVYEPTDAYTIYAASASAYLLDLGNRDAYGLLNVLIEHTRI